MKSQCFNIYRRNRKNNSLLYTTLQQSKQLQLNLQINTTKLSKWRPSRTLPTTSPRLFKVPLPLPPRRPTSKSPRTVMPAFPPVPTPVSMPSRTRLMSLDTTPRLMSTRRLPSTKFFNSMDLAICIRS